MTNHQLSSYRHIIKRLAYSDDPISCRTMSEELDVRGVTVRRAVKCLREELKAPIVSSRSGYAWRPYVHEYSHAKALLEVFGK